MTRASKGAIVCVFGLGRGLRSFPARLYALLLAEASCARRCPRYSHPTHTVLVFSSFTTEDIDEMEKTKRIIPVGGGGYGMHSTRLAVD